MEPLCAAAKKSLAEARQEGGFLLRRCSVCRSVAAGGIVCRSERAWLCAATNRIPSAQLVSPDEIKSPAGCRPTCIAIGSRRYLSEAGSQPHWPALAGGSRREIFRRLARGVDPDQVPVSRYQVWSYSDTTRLWPHRLCARSVRRRAN